MTRKAENDLITSDYKYSVKRTGSLATSENNEEEGS